MSEVTLYLPMVRAWLGSPDGLTQLQRWQNQVAAWAPPLGPFLFELLVFLEQHITEARIQLTLASVDKQVEQIGAVFVAQDTEGRAARRINELRQEFPTAAISTIELSGVEFNTEEKIGNPLFGILVTAEASDPTSAAGVLGAMMQISSLYKIESFTPTDHATSS